MSFKAYDANTYSFIYPSKQVDITTLYNAIGEKLQQSGVVVNFSLANGAGLWQGVGGENRVISIIERGLFFCFVTVTYTVNNTMIEICYAPQVKDRNYTDSVRAMRYSQWDLCSRTVLDAVAKSIVQVAGKPIVCEVVLSNNYIFRLDTDDLVADYDAEITK